MLSLLVLLIPTVLLVGAYQIVAGRTEPVPVDQSQEIDAARRAGFDVAEPTGLGAEWVPVSAVFRQVEGGATLRLGYLTPAGAPVQVVESTVAADQVLVQELSDGGTPPVPTGVVTVAGSAWERYPGRDGETALVRREPERILLVVGRADESELRQLATALAGWRGATPAALYRGWPGRPGSSGPAGRPRVDSRRSRAPSSQRWQIAASCSPRSHSASASSRVQPPASSRSTTDASSARACS